MNFHRRVFAMILVICMVFPLQPGELGSLFVFKASAAGSGTSGDPFEITNTADLVNALKNHTSETHFRQTSDFELICANTADFKEFKEFKGKYDGNGYTITVTTGSGTDGRFYARVFNAGSEFTKNSDPGVYGGLFDSITSTAVVENLLMNITVDFYGRAGYTWYTGGTDYFGAIAGKNNGGTIKNCDVKGNVVMRQRYADKYWITKDEYNQTEYNNITQRPCTSVAGGIAGLVTAGGKVQGCRNRANIYMTTNTASMIYVQWNRSGGDVKGNVAVYYTLYAGGIAGEISGNGSTVEACISEGSSESGKLYLGNGMYGTNTISSSVLTSGAGGSIAGLMSNGMPTVRYNIVRNSGVYADMTSKFGAAGYLIGHVATSDGASTGSVSKNFGQGTNTTQGGKSGSAMFTGNKSLFSNFSSLTGVDTGYSTSSLTALSQVDNTSFLVHTNGAETYPIVLKWLTVAAPALQSSAITAATAGTTGRLDIVVDIPYAFAPINPQTRLTKEDVRYELIIKGQNGAQKFYYTYSSGIHNVDGFPPADPATQVRLYKNDINILTTDSIELRTWTNGQEALGRNTMTNIYKLSATGTTQSPQILPNDTDSLADGIAMSAASGATIYYTWTFDGSTPATPTATESDKNFKYTGPISWDTIEPLFTGAQMKIKAYAVKSGENDSAITEITYTAVNKPSIGPPGISIGSQPFIRTSYYEPGASVTLTHDESTGGEIWYTVDGSTPDKGRNVGVKYDQPYVLPTDGRSYVEIKAYLWRSNYPPSQILSETINIKARHGTPIYSIRNNAEIPVGQTLSFILRPSDLPEAIRPSFFMKEGDNSVYTAEEVANNNADYYGVLEVNYDNFSSFQYSTYLASIPTLTYTIDGNTRTYSFGTPEIRYIKDGEEVIDARKSHVSGNKIVLDGKAGGQISVTAQLKANDKNIYTDGTETVQTFSFFEATQTPMAAPGTSGDNPTTLSVGNTVSLSCATSGAQIFYSTTGTPLVMWSDKDNKYIPARYVIINGSGQYIADNGLGVDVDGDGDIDPSSGDIAPEPQRTFDYNKISGTGITVTGNAGGYFTIYVGAVAQNKSASELVSFTYRIAGLSTVAAPTATPVTSVSNVATIGNNSSVVLVSATSGARIFYNTKGVPTFDSNGKPTGNTIDYNDEKASTGITVDGTPGGVYTIYAVAKKDGMSDSGVVTLTYKIDELPVAAAPVSNPKTADDNMTTLPMGSKISLNTATSGAGIYYSDSSGTSNKLYTAAEGVEVKGTPGGFFTITAVAKSTAPGAMTDSPTVNFTYKIEELPVAAAPTATPNTADGSPVTLQSGSVVTLQTATSGALIFYSLTGTPVVNKSDTTYSAGAGTFLFDKSITVSGSAGEFFVIRAITVKDGYQDSEIAIFTYQLPAPVQAVYATPGEGTVVKGTEVTLATTTDGTTIYYETATREHDLDDPIPGESPVYSKPIKIEERTYITAIAVKDSVESIITEYEYKVASTVGVPEPSIPSGSVVAKGAKLILSSSTSGASITYTKDGSDPADEKNTKRMYGSEIAIDAEEGKSVSISAYAHKTGMTPSEVVSISYTVSKSNDVMTANPAADSTVKPGDRITLSTSVTGSEIYYTTDGSEPTKDSEKGSTVLVDGAHGEAFIIRAVAATESTITAPYIFSYKIVARTPAPSASIPNGAIILEGATVTLTAPEGNIYYTTDGSDPNGSSQMYTEAFELTGSTVLKAIAIADDKAQSETAEYIYTMAGQVASPTASQPSGTIDVGSKVTLSTTTEGAAIYYTTNGTTPTVDNLRDCFTYEGPIIISRPVSIRMFAVKTGMNASVVNTATYTVAYPAEEETEEQDTSTVQRDSDRLFLFDQFVDSGEGPLFEDIVLRDTLTLTVVSAAGDALPEGVQLMVARERSPSTEDEDAVMKSLEMKLVALYNITLVDQSGNQIQPLSENGVEVGVPIPEGYEDTIVLICRINENGTVTAFPTRRSAGMLYAVVDHFSKYAVAVPPPLDAKESWFKTWYLRLLVAGAAMAGIAALTVVIVKKRKKVKASE